MRRIFRTRRPPNFKLGRRTEPRFAKVNILIFLLSTPSATNENTQQHDASRGLSAIAELFVIRGNGNCVSRWRLSMETASERHASVSTNWITFLSQNLSAFRDPSALIVPWCCVDVTCSSSTNQTLVTCKYISSAVAERPCTRYFMALNILRSYSMSLKVIRNDTLGTAGVSPVSILL